MCERHPWQSVYEQATGGTGRVVDVFGRLGRFGGLALWVEVEQPGADETVFFSPYLDQSPGDGEHREMTGDDQGRSRDDETGRWCQPCHCGLCSYESDPQAWVEMMAGAADWEAWDWGSGSNRILEH